MEQKYCIIIARQFGSLGRQIGKQLAKELDIAYYDRELLEHAAESMGLPVSSLADLDDKMSGTFQKMLYPLGISSSATQSKLFEVQKTMILDAANKSSCVIVGKHILIDSGAFGLDGSVALLKKAASQKFVLSNP